MNYEGRTREEKKSKTTKNWDCELQFEKHYELKNSQKVKK